MSRPVAPADYPGCPITVTQALEEGRELRPPRWGLWDVVIGGVGTLVLAAVSLAVLTVMNAPISLQVLVGTSVPWLALAGWPIIATIRRGNGPRIDLGLRLTWSDTGWGVAAGLVGLLAAGAAALLTRLVVPDVTSSASEAAQQLEAGAGRPALMVFGLMILVGAPLVEELFFRGLFFAALRKRGVGALVSILITAVAFAAFHFEPTRFLVLLPTGLVLGWVRWRTGTTGASMIGHGVVNAPGAVVLLVGLPDMSP